MSMIMAHNLSSGFEVDILNMEDANNARVTMLVDNEYPATSWPTSINYTAEPWEYMQVQMDWSKKYINYTVNYNKTRIFKKKDDIPTEPLPLVFRHWSIGDVEWMQGPPYERNEADLAWVRAFFNSSLTTKATRKEFDTRCLAQPKCDVDDHALRGASTYSPKALIPYKEPAPSEAWRIPAVIVLGAATALGLLTLINVFFKRKPWKTMFNGEKRYEPAVLDLGAGLTSPYVQPELTRMETPGEKRPSIVVSQKSRKNTNTSTTITDIAELDEPAAVEPGVRRRSILRTHRFESTPASNLSPNSARSANASHEARRNLFQPNFSFGGASMPEVATHDFGESATGLPARTRQMSLFAQSRIHSTAAQSEDDEYAEFRPRDVRDRQASVFQSVVGSIARLASVAPTVEEKPEELPTNEHLGEADNIDIHEWNTQPRQSIATIDPPFNALAGGRRPTIAEAVPIASDVLPPVPAKAKEQRVNYLAGLVAFSCLLVTATHFCLTFVPYAGGLDQGIHYESEVIARYFATPLLFDPIWLGPLFVTSCRFLAGGFLKKGDLKEIASRTLLRAPRMLIPVIIVAMLEYFFLEEGVLEWIAYLPSISWSSWPYIDDYGNFGYFINDILELGYLYPNAAPQIVPHYCVGILWTVPVQLQFSYTALLAAVIVRDINNVHKRFFVYAIAIITNWYALNWGSCFWAGVLLADLQLTYDVSTKLQRNPMIWYPLAVLLWCIALTMPMLSMLEDRFDISTLTAERNVHPEFSSGKPLGQTSAGGYPLYFEPRANTLIFAVCIQFLLETSTWFQAFFSLRFWQPVFPHAYTVYLTHGFVWWSLGSFTVVHLSARGIPYWLVLLINAIVCYSCLALAVIVLTPLTEMTNAAFCRNIQRWAMSAPVPNRPTLSPFPHALILGRNSDDKEDAETDEEMAATQAPAHAHFADDPEEKEKEKEGPRKSSMRRPTLFTVEEVNDPSATSTQTGSSGTSSVSSLTPSQS